jgi:uncharacterized membrane protein YheB (UPF0754 family)
MLYWYLSFPFISALIGWFTNWVAVKMLFYPRMERRIMFMRIQGVFPKRKKVLGERLGKIVAKELFSKEVIKEKIDNEDVRAQLKGAILKEVENYLEEMRKSNKLLAMVAGEGVVQNIKGKVGEKLDELIPKLMGQFANRIDEQLHIEQIVADRVDKFSHERLEQVLNAVMDQELKFITQLGGWLGFVVGLVQTLITLLIQA